MENPPKTIPEGFKKTTIKDIEQAIDNVGRKQKERNLRLAELLKEHRRIVEQAKKDQDKKRANELSQRLRS